MHTPAWLALHVYPLNGNILSLVALSYHLGHSFSPLLDLAHSFLEVNSWTGMAHLSTILIDVCFTLYIFSASLLCFWRSCFMSMKRVEQSQKILPFVTIWLFFCLFTESLYSIIHDIVWLGHLSIVQSLFTMLVLCHLSLHQLFWAHYAGHTISCIGPWTPRGTRG